MMRLFEIEDEIDNRQKFIAKIYKLNKAPAMDERFSKICSWWMKQRVNSKK